MSAKELEIGVLEKAPNGCWASGVVIIPPSGGNGAAETETTNTVTEPEETKLLRC